MCDGLLPADCSFVSKVCWKQAVAHLDSLPKDEHGESISDQTHPLFGDDTGFIADSYCGNVDFDDLVNRLEIETRNGRQGRIAEHLTRMDFIVLDELGYLPFAQSGGQLLFHLVSRLYAPPSSSPPISRSASGLACSATPR